MVVVRMAIALGVAMMEVVEDTMVEEEVMMVDVEGMVSAVEDTMVGEVVVEVTMLVEVDTTVGEAVVEDMVMEATTEEDLVEEAVVDEEISAIEVAVMEVFPQEEVVLVAPHVMEDMVAQIVVDLVDGMMEVVAEHEEDSVAAREVPVEEEVFKTVEAVVALEEIEEMVALELARTIGLN